MRVAVLSANLGAYECPHSWVTQRPPHGITIDVYRFTDANVPPRPLAMTSRLLCGLPKMFGAWQFAPGYDAYMWVDASCALLHEDSVAWFLDQLDGAELAVFRHPDRRTIREEYEFMLERMARPDETYLNSRYKGEWLQSLYEEIATDTSYVDDRLYASTAFAYKPTPRVQLMMTHWWLTKSRWSLHDQIAWPYVIAKAGCSVNVIEQSYLKCPYLTYVRNKKRAA